jgi:hypothetical protein
MSFIHVCSSIWPFGTAEDLGLLKLWTMVIDPHVSEEAVDFTTDILRFQLSFLLLLQWQIVSLIITIIHEILRFAGDTAIGVDGRSKRRWNPKGGDGRSQCPHDLRRRSALACLLGLRVRIPPGVWMPVCSKRCVFSGRGLCVELSTCLEESSECVCVCVRALVCHQQPR